MKHAIYRIHTEDKNKEEILEECTNMVASFACYSVTGYWKGEEEQGITLEFVLHDTVHNDALIRCLAESIKHMNKQEAVLLTKTEAVAQFI